MVQWNGEVSPSWLQGGHQVHPVQWHHEGAQVYPPIDLQHSWPWLAHPLGTVGDAIYPVAYDNFLAYELLTMGRQLPRICMDCN